MKTSPTQRSLAYLRKQGWQCAVLERWNPHAMIRQDVWGFADLIACREPVRYGDTEVKTKLPMTIYTRPAQIALVQTTTLAHMVERRAKILAEPRAGVWMRSGGIILLHGWRKIGKRGKRKLWEVKEEVL